jgi:hypothetical protein
MIDRLEEELQQCRQETLVLRHKLKHHDIVEFLAFMNLLCVHQVIPQLFLMCDMFTEM